MQPNRNIAARAGRWSAQHRKIAIFGWIAFVILAFMIGGGVGTHTLTKQQAGVGESGQAAKIVDGAYPTKVHESVLVQSIHLKTGAPAFRAAVDDVAAGSRTPRASPGSIPLRWRRADLARRPHGAGGLRGPRRRKGSGRRKDG